MKTLLTGLVLLAGTVAARADEFDSIVRKAMLSSHLPGVSIAIVKNGRVIRESGYGFAELENRVPARPKSVYELASLSKQFTAVATMMLVEEGKLGLDDPVSKFCPEAPTAWESMKVRNLLNHTSGLPEFHFDPGRLSALSFLRYRDEQQIKDMAKSSLRFQPGTRMGYSNAGYSLLGIILRRVTGQPLETFLKARIFDPIGMTQTQMGDPTRVIPDLAGEYTWRNGAWAPWRLSATLASVDTNGFGGLVSSVEDLAKWEIALDQKKLLKPESWQQMWTPEKLADGSVVGNSEGPYGFGWNVVNMPYGQILMHEGYTGTAMVAVPSKHLGLILLTNHGDGNPRPFSRDEGFDVHGLGLALLKCAVDKYGE